MRDRPSDAHRRLTERELGRALSPNEVVDHVDENKANNAKANRRVMPRGAHTAHHNARRVTGKIVKALAINRTTKIY